MPPGRGEVTLVHRRLWPALVRVAERFPKNHVAQVRQEAYRLGRHVNRRSRFQNGFPLEVREARRTSSEEEALGA